MNFVWGASSVAFMVASCLLLILFKPQLAADLMFAMLSGSVAGLATGMVSFVGGASPHRTVLHVFVGIVGAAGSWLFAWVLLLVTTVSLYSNTALAFDLTVGIVGAVTACMAFAARPAENVTPE